ncbi:hypothetical protein PHMEG_00033935, partial [Phytophthora megakarya]
LFRLILEKALDQDRVFQRRKCSRGKNTSETRRKDNQSDSNNGQPRTKYRKVERGDKPAAKNNGSRANQAQKRPEKRNTTPPTGGCLKCKGDHWLIHCKEASGDEKKELLRQMHERLCLLHCIFVLSSSCLSFQPTSARIGRSLLTMACFHYQDVTTTPRFSCDSIWMLSPRES